MPAASRAWKRAIAICRDLALPLYVHYAVPLLAVAYALSGCPVEAVGLLEQQSGECHHALTLSTLGEVYREAGRPLTSLV